MTPEEQIVVIRAKAEGKKIEWTGKEPNPHPWVLMYPTDEFNFARSNYRIAQPPIAKGHNPDKLTVEQVGEGWRLLSREEITFTRRGVVPVQLWDNICNKWHGEGWFADEPYRTYRTQKPEGYFLPKKKVKVKVEGWINVYRSGTIGNICRTREVADKMADRSRFACKHLVFEIEEGEGLP